MATERSLPAPVTTGDELLLVMVDELRQIKRLLEPSTPQAAAGAGQPTKKPAKKASAKKAAPTAAPRSRSTSKK